MMKFLKLSMLVFASAAYSQNISDFTYVQIAPVADDFQENKFGLAELLANKLAGKKFKVLNSDTAVWPEAAKNNPCNVLKAEIHNTSSFLKNKLRVDFKDCNNKTVASSEGQSNIKEYEAGYRNALEKAISTLQNSNPVEKKLAANTEMVQNDQPNEITIEAVTEKKQVAVQPKQSAGVKAQTFSNGTVNVKRITISENQFILANPDNSTPYAIFNASTKKDIYRVQFHDGTQTLGYFEDGNIVIERKNADETYDKEILRAQ